MTLRVKKSSSSLTPGHTILARHSTFCKNLEPSRFDNSGGLSDRRAIAPPQGASIARWNWRYANGAGICATYLISE